MAASRRGQRRAAVEAVMKHNGDPNRKTELVVEPIYEGVPFQSPIIGWRTRVR
jgi:hypothetical protein